MGQTDGNGALDDASLENVAGGDGGVIYFCTRCLTCEITWGPMPGSSIPACEGQHTAQSGHNAFSRFQV